MSEETPEIGVRLSTTIVLTVFLVCLLFGSVCAKTCASDNPEKCIQPGVRHPE